MKIRNGFVSNSSSSSFVIRTDGKFKTVADVAEFIMCEMQAQWDDDYSIELMELKNMTDKDTPVYFYTSDGGYIRKFKDHIIVSTTHHYDPGFILSNEMVNFNDFEENYFNELEFYDEECEKYNDDPYYRITSMESFDYYWKQFNDFFLLKSGVRGKFYYDFKNRCEKCNGCERIELNDGSNICKCEGTKKNIRKLKLKNIEDES